MKYHHKVSRFLNQKQATFLMSRYTINHLMSISNLWHVALEFRLKNENMELNTLKNYLPLSDKISGRLITDWPKMVIVLTSRYLLENRKYR